MDVVDTKHAYALMEGEEKFNEGNIQQIEIENTYEITDFQLKLFMQDQNIMFLQKELCCLQLSDLLDLTNTDFEHLSAHLSAAEKIRFRNALNNLRTNHSLKKDNKPANRVRKITSFDGVFKVIITGDCGVGKSCILSRFAKDEFTTSYNTTMGLKYEHQTVEINENKTVQLKVFDTSGSHEQFGTISNAFFRGAHACLIVYDVTKQESFHNVVNRIGECNMFTDEKSWKILVGNKCDLIDKRAIARENGQQLAYEYNMKFMECSAKMGTNIDALFNIAAQYLLDIWKQPNPKILVNQNKKKDSNCCMVL